VSSDRLVRTHAAEAVFDRLAATVCAGEWPPGAALPPERALAERFGVSRPIVRQATHRMARIGLVRVRQGGATIVADPSGSPHPEAAAMRARYGGRRAQRELLERQVVAPLAILALAERDRSPEGSSRLTALIEELDAGADPFAVEERLWIAVAELSGCGLLEVELGFWRRVARDVAPGGGRERGEPEVHRDACREVARRLRDGEDAASYWLVVARRAVDRLRAEPDLSRDPER
jgi:DNA-binding FadR family transcriptional regulator